MDRLAITNFQSIKAGTYRMTAVNPTGSVAGAPASVLLNGPMRLDSFTSSPSNHLFQMRLVGIANTNYVLQASTDMVTWIPIATNSAPNGLWTFTDTQSTNFPNRYYRAVPAN